MLEFLSQKAHVIHGDISINNIMINRVWDYESNKSPSQLCTLASTKATIFAQPAHNISTMSQHRALHGASVNRPTFSTRPKVESGGTMDHIECSGMLIDCDFM